MKPDFRDMLSALSAEGAEFLVVDAFALGVHGYPRATGDIDLWVRPTPENASRVMRALRRFGAPLHDLTESDLATAGVVFQIGLPPTRIDIRTEISGVDFESAWAQRTPHAWGNLHVAVLGREDLIRNKRAAGRPKDLLDVMLLEGEGERPA
jgi:hypothetical protein